jgi:hypothetical protein
MIHTILPKCSLIQAGKRTRSQKRGGRSVFPTLSAKSIGKKQYSTAPFYKNYGYKIDFQLQEEITPEFISNQNQLGQWINENAIIRLYGILHHHELYNEINQNCNGWKEMDLIRRMRNVFTKTSLDYKPTDADNKRLREEIIKHFKLKESDFHEKNIPYKIPTPIDTVILPLFTICCEYIKEINKIE